MTKTFMDEVIDAINTITTSEATKTRTHITQENNQLSARLDSIDDELKRLNIHLEKITGERINDADI